MAGQRGTSIGVDYRNTIEPGRRHQPAGPSAVTPVPGPGGAARPPPRLGGLALSGSAEGPPAVPRGDVVAAASAVSPLDEAALGDLLFGRAALMGLARRGRRSPGGATRLLATTDGWVAVTLARVEDEAAVPAIVRDPAETQPADPWAALTGAAARLTGRELVGRCIDLGVPAAVLDETSPGQGLVARRLSERRGAGDLIVDLSALWAGPLCAHLLGRTGRPVVKVEARAERGSARSRAFFDGLRAGHASLVVDLPSPDGVEVLRGLLDRAAVVIEASRPRALRQWGVDADEVVARTGCVWVSITGHGRRGPAARRVGLGDDTAVAGGLVADDHSGPTFAGDALGDPLTGIRAAAGALEALESGGGWLLDVAMAGIVADAVVEHPLACRPTFERDGDGWVAACCGGRDRVMAPRAAAGLAPAWAPEGTHQGQMGAAPS